MKQGFVKVAAVTPDIRVADVEFNKEQICRKMDEAAASGAKIIVLPEHGGPRSAEPRSSGWRRGAA